MMIRSRFTLELTGWTTFFAFSFVALVPLGHAQDIHVTPGKKSDGSPAIQPNTKVVKDARSWTPPPVVRSKPARPPAYPLTVSKSDSSFKEADAKDPQLLKRSRVLRLPVVRSLERQLHKGKGGAHAEALELASFGSALERYQKNGGAESTRGRKALENFLSRHPDGDYSPSIRLELADAYWRTGAWEKALEQWEKAWARASKHDTEDVEARRLGDVVLSHLLKHTTLLGRKERLRSLLEEISDRKSGGDANGAIHRAKEMLWFLDNRAEQNVFCGFSAANLVCEPLGKRPIFPDVHDKDEERKFIASGASLWDIAEHSHEAGGDLRCVLKTDTTAALVVPSVIHWKFGHFSAVTENGADGKVHLEDAQLKFNSWVEPSVIAEAGSGYALIPGSTPLPPGYREVPEEEARAVTGRHCVHGYDDEGQDPEKCPCESSTGMAVYSLNLRRAYHSIMDTPLSYSLPDGNKVSFTVSYSARPAGTTSLSNTYGFGPLWFSPFAGGSLELKGTGTPANSSIEWHMGNGSYTTYSLYGGAYLRKQAELPVLTYVQDDGDGRSGYQLSYSDGSHQFYTWPVNSPATRYLLSKEVDPQGNRKSYGYDASTRLVSVTDSWGYTSSISYVPEAGDAASATAYPGRVRRITDPFGRYATFIYDSDGRLTKITDAVGITSQFQYTVQDVITELITPYGTTSFSLGYNFIEVTDTRGFKERVIQTDSEPFSTLNAAGGGEAAPATNFVVRDWDSSDGYHGDRTARAPLSVNGVTFVPKNNNLHWRNSFYWDKKAMYHGGNDWNAATVYNWKASSNSFIVPALSSMRSPGQGRVWFNYPGQFTADGSVTSYQPSKTVRQIENENGVPTWVMTQMTYNSLGLPLTLTDELGRSTYTEYVGNGPDMKYIAVAGAGTLRTFAYDGSHPHLPSTVTEASGLETKYSYNERHQVTQVEKKRGSQSEIIRFTYSSARVGSVSPWPGTPGFLRKIERTSPANPAEWVTVQQMTYDTTNRLLSTLDATLYETLYDYDDLDRPTLITHTSNNTTEQFHYDKLDLAATKDRAGRWTRTLYNSERLPVAKIAVDENVTQFEWCLCGQLQKLTDALGRETKWTWAPGGYLLEKLMPDGVTKTTYTYQPNSGRLASITRPNQQGSGSPTVSYRYFVDGRIQKEDYSDNSTTTGAADVLYSYETSGLGRLLNVTDGIGTHSYSYRPFGVEGGGAVEYINGPLQNDRMQFVHDWQDRVAAEKLFNDGDSTELRVEERTWDSLGRPATVVNALGTLTHGYLTPLERLDSITRSTGITTTFSYNPDNAAGSSARALASITHARSGDGTVVASHQYGHDKLGRITSWEIQGEGIVGNVRHFEHNTADELIRSRRLNTGDNSVVEDERWALDAVGNWISNSRSQDSTLETRTHNVMNRLTSIGGAGTTKVAGTVNEYANVSVNGQAATVSADPAGGYRYEKSVTVQPGLNMVAVHAVDTSGQTTTKQWQFNVPATSRTFSYDANGNVLSDGQRTFTWDVKNRLRSVTKGGATWKWDYDFQDRRVKEYENNTLTEVFVWKDTEIIQQRNASNIISRTHYVGGFVDGVNAAQGTKYQMLTDHLGNVRELVDPVGVVATRYDYNCYQSPIKISGALEATFQTIGRYYHHAGSGLELAMYRAYDGKLGRWMNEDPFGSVQSRMQLSFVNKESSKYYLAGILHPELLPTGSNLYSFVGNNPIVLADPEGEVAPFIVWSGGVLVGIAFDYVVDKIKNRDVKCPDAAWSPDASTAANAETGAAVALTLPTRVKRGGVAGGGRSGLVTSMASQVNHARVRTPVIRNRITAVLRKVPYLGTLIGVAQLGDAIVNPNEGCPE